MKIKLLILLFLPVFLFSQNPELLGNNWKIVSLQINNQTLTPTIDNNKITLNNSNFTAEYFNMLTSTILYIGTQQFNISNAHVTIVDSFNPSIAMFDGNYLENFFGLRNPADMNYIIPKNPFTYNIIGNQLTIINANGDIATYSKVILSTSEIEDRRDVIIYPNPAKDYIFISGERNIPVTFYDASGNLVLKSKITVNGIDISFLKTGIYYIEIKDQKPMKLMKY